MVTKKSLKGQLDKSGFITLLWAVNRKETTSALLNYWSTWEEFYLDFCMLTFQTRKHCSVVKISFPRMLKSHIENACNICCRNIFFPRNKKMFRKFFRNIKLFLQQICCLQAWKRKHCCGNIWWFLQQCFFVCGSHAPWTLVSSDYSFLWPTAVKIQTSYLTVRNYISYNVKRH